MQSVLYNLIYYIKMQSTTYGCYCHSKDVQRQGAHPGSYNSRAPNTVLYSLTDSNALFTIRTKWYPMYII